MTVLHRLSIREILTCIIYTNIYTKFDILYLDLGCHWKWFSQIFAHKCFVKFVEFLHHQDLQRRDCPFFVFLLQYKRISNVLNSYLGCISLRILTEVIVNLSLHCVLFTYNLIIPIKAHLHYRKYLAWLG